MRGLDPRIHLFKKMMDCRVKPGNDVFVNIGHYRKVALYRPREKREISTGNVTRITSGAINMPATTTTAKGFCT